LYRWCLDSQIRPLIAEIGPLEKVPEFLVEITERRLIGRAILEP
jgi:hypothetical protein